MGVEVKGEGFSPVTKLITIVPGDLALSVIHLERAGMPRMVVLSLLVTLLGALGYVMCRNAGRKGRLRNSHTGFQKIRSTDQFTDSEDDEIEFDKTLEKMGLRKNVGVGNYQDYSSTSEEEDLLLSKP